MKQRTFEVEFATLELLSTQSGCCVLLNGYRIAGEKPFGRSLFSKKWIIPVYRIQTALKSR